MIENLLTYIGKKERFLTYNLWKEEALKRYESIELIKFRCPKCGYVASAKDYTEQGLNPSAAGFVCLGFYTGEDKRFVGGPCRYSPIENLNENPILIKIENQCFVRIFDFADNPIESAEKCLATLQVRNTE
jgi:hypothetical protein